MKFYLIIFSHQDLKIRISDVTNISSIKDVVYHFGIVYVSWKVLPFTLLYYIPIWRKNSIMYQWHVTY